ncbi:MAG: biotin/lipoyl-containing protein, partial [Dokdonella sp.]|uniref:biotin/lipoyl-containing protein n=1 Tax=Dokdonella sp. TaxID=2291710 RepID=UPI003BAF643F
MASHEVKVPDIGNYTGIPVIEVLVKPGDTVSKDQGLVTLESDKATMEVPSSVAGVVKELKVKLGDEISEGTVVAIIEADATDSSVAKNAAPPPPAAAPVPARSEPTPVPPAADAKAAARTTIDTSNPMRLSEIEIAALAPDVDPERMG